MRSSQISGQMISIAIVDSGPLIAAANRADPAHASCVAALQAPRVHLIIPALCVVEVAYLIQRHQGPQVEARFLRALVGLDVQAPTDEDWPRMADLVEEYADFPLGGTDASVIAIAERVNTSLLITLDRRHFAAVRPLHRERFRLLPESAWSASGAAILLYKERPVSKMEMFTSPSNFPQGPPLSGINCVEMM